MNNSDVAQKYQEAKKILDEITAPLLRTYTDETITISCPECGTAFATTLAGAIWTPEVHLFCCGKLRV